MAYWWFWWRAFMHLNWACERVREHWNELEAESVRRFGKGTP